MTRESKAVAAVLHEEEAGIYYLQEQATGIGLPGGPLRGRREAPHEAICRILAEQTSLERVRPELFEDPFNPAARVYTVEKSKFGLESTKTTYVYDLLVAKNARIESKTGQMIRLKGDEIMAAISLNGLTEVAKEFFVRHWQ